MGPALNGLLLNFQSITSLGGLGDLGMGGLVNIQASRLLGQGKEDELRKTTRPSADKRRKPDNRKELRAE